MGDKKYLDIVSHYESCLHKYGDTHLGVDWPNQEDADTRYSVMLEVIKPDASGEVSLLDFGCGVSHLCEYIQKHGLTEIKYSGLDLSVDYVDISKRKFPHVDYYCLDILENPAAIPDFDYILMNGVFTEKCSLSFDEMFAYLKRIVSLVFSKATRGIAFNVMSSHVDWERDDLFHLPVDALATFLTKAVSRDFVIRNDYGLYEYTTYVYQRL